MGRNFTRRQRTAIYLAADGKSDASGEPLGDNFHADHLVPYSAGGETDVANGRALTPGENLMKANRHVELRNWQKSFLQEWLISQKDFLLSALPGAGKTIAALCAAKQFLEETRFGKVFIIVPSTNLRDQWQAEAWQAFGISLQSKEFYGTLKSDHAGAVTTYQTVANDHLVFRAMTSRQPTMVIFDEIHHAGDERSWGDAIKKSFEMAGRRLCLSGTPFRTDGTAVPFLRYDANGYCLPDMIYDYPNAIKDGVVRIVSFHHNAGEVEYLKNGEHLTASINQNVSEEEAKSHLRKLLSADGQFARSLIEKANSRLLSIRRVKPNAAGLILCIDSFHAIEVAKVIQQITGERPDVVLSDDEKANSSVESFRSSNRPWIVAVRQVSEGVDIKRLMVLVYLTNTVTELFFRQAIGRIVRNEGTEFDDESYCYLPDDPRLIGMAKRIIDSQVAALKEMEEEDEKERQSGERQADTSIVVLGTSEAESRGIIIEGQQYQLGDAAVIREVSQKAGISETKAAMAIEIARMHLSPSPRADASHDPPQPQTTRAVTKSPEQQSTAIRTKIKSQVNRLSKITGKEHKEIHKRYFAISSTPQDKMSLQQLKDKLQWLDNQIRQA